MSFLKSASRIYVLVHTVYATLSFMEQFINVGLLSLILLFCRRAIFDEYT